MANFKTHKTSLDKAQIKFDKANRQGVFSKELELHFERSQNSSGRYITKPKVMLRTAEYHYKPAGILHTLDHKAKHNITGDIPSISKVIDSYQPRSLKGHAAKLTLKTANYVVKNSSRAAWSVGLGAETAAILAYKNAGNAIKSGVSTYYQKNAADDLSKAALKSGRLLLNARSGYKNHLRKKQKFSLQRARYKLQKEQYRNHLTVHYKPRIKAIRLEKRNAYRNIIPHAKDRIKKAKLNLKKTSRFSADYKLKQGLVKARKLRYKVREIEYESVKSDLKYEKKQLKVDKRFLKKDLKSQLKITKQSDPGLLIMKPLKYGVKSMAASAWQKAAVADDRNDTANAIDKAHKITKKIQKKRKSALDKTQKRKEQLRNKNIQKQTKLQKKQTKLQKKSSLLDNQARKRRIRPPKRKKHKDIVHVVSVPLRSFGVFVTIICLILVIMMIVLTLFNGIMSSIFGNSEWVMGTYSANDSELSKAESYYTELAKKFNDKLLKVGSYDDWKSGLKDFDIDVSDYDDKPDIISFGRCADLDYDPVYDFDKYKLWSFLCAYFYEYHEESTDSESEPKDKDIKYWKCDSTTEDLIKELFNTEYTFEHKYYNASHWEELSPYNYWGGGSAEYGTYYQAEPEAYQGGSGDKYAFKFKPRAITDELAKFRDEEGFIFIDKNYRVLDPNDKFKETGFYIRDHRYFAGSSKPFYYYETSTDRYFFKHGDKNYYRNGWGWDGVEAWFYVGPIDTNIWNNTLHDVCMYAYYEKYRWETDCKLFYNVKQNKSFDEVIYDKLNSMDHAEERISYYETVLGTAEDAKTSRGNHQNFECPLEGSITLYEREGKILHGYGYDMQEWNTTHCELDDEHKAIDILCPANSDVIAGMDGTITEISNDPKKNIDMIVIRHDDYDYWYDGDGKGKKRDTEIKYYNVKTDLSVGDEVKAGDIIGKTLPQRYCAGESTGTGSYYLHIEIEFDVTGPGWANIDPILVFK